MSKNQIETDLSFNYISGIKNICKLIITNKGDIFLGLPNITEDNEITFLIEGDFPEDIYNNCGAIKIAYNEIKFKDISKTINKFKLSYHPDGFVQFSGTGKIISGKDKEGNAKGFGNKSLSFNNMCEGPFIGINLNGDLGLLKYQNKLKNYTILPILKKGKYNKYIDLINNEKNITLELFLRKIDNKFKIKYPNYQNIELLNLPHPNEGKFFVKKFLFKQDDNFYLLGVRTLIRDIKTLKKMNIDNDGICYSISTTTTPSKTPGKISSISCYHGNYWKNLFFPKINKEIDL